MRARDLDVRSVGRRSGWIRPDISSCGQVFIRPAQNGKPVNSCQIPAGTFAMKRSGELILITFDPALFPAGRWRPGARID